MPCRSISQYDIGRQSLEVETRFRRLDEDRAALAAQVSTLATERARLESELRDVYKKWEEDNRRSSIEKRRLADQLQQLGGAGYPGAISFSESASEYGAAVVDHEDRTTTPGSVISSHHGGGASVQGSRVASSLAPSQQQRLAVGDATELWRLRQERHAILKNWAEETEILITLWREDKQSFEAERATYKAQIASLQHSIERRLVELEQASSSTAATNYASSRLSSTSRAMLDSNNIRRERDIATQGLKMAGQQVNELIRRIMKYDRSPAKAERKENEFGSTAGSASFHPDMSLPADSGPLRGAELSPEPMSPFISSRR